jgi:hypothetical protein
MRNVRFQLLFFAAMVIGIFLAAVSLSWAQDQSKAVVVKATKHAFAPPLSQMEPIPAPSGQMSSVDDDDDRLLIHGSRATNRAPDSALQGSAQTNLGAALSALSTNSGLNILGVGDGFPGYSNQAVVPDSNVAVGPTQVVQFVDRSFAVFNKSNGAVAYGPASGNTLWQALGAPCDSQTNSDEIVQFDKQAGVWVMLMPSWTYPNQLCVAVSTTDDATNGGWNLYVYLVPRVMFADYPKLAVWPDAYYLTYNQGDDLVFVGAAACAFDRSAMLTGAPAPTMQCFDHIPTSYGVLLPGDLDGATPPPTGSPEYFLNFDGNDASLDLWQFHVDWTTPANSWFGSSSTDSSPTNIPVAAFTEACGETATELLYTTGACIPQIGTTQKLDSYGDRLMYRLAYRNFGIGNGNGGYEDLVVNHTVTLGTSSSQTGVRWYELQNPGTGFGLYQQGTYAPDSSYRWMGSIAMDHNGDIALGYSVSSATMSPSIRYTGRVPGDALGTMESEIDILSAASVAHGSQTTSYRWADYSGMSIDPTDDCTFFYTTEYIPTTGSSWSTRIASFSFQSCGPGFTLTPTPLTASVSAGGTAVFNLAVAAQGGFTGQVALSCSAPTTQGVNCSLSPTSAQPGTPVKLTVTTTGSSAALTLPPGDVPSHPLYLAWIGVPAVALMGLGSLRLRSMRRGLAFLLLCFALCASVAIQVACSSSGSGNGGGGSGSGATPAGSYTVNITAVSGSIQHTSSVSVTVQ